MRTDRTRKRNSERPSRASDWAALFSNSELLRGGGRGRIRLLIALLVATEDLLGSMTYILGARFRALANVFGTSRGGMTNVFAPSLVAWPVSLAAVLVACPVAFAPVAVA